MIKPLAPPQAPPRSSLQNLQECAANAPYESLSSRMGRVFDTLIALNRSLSTLRWEMFSESNNPEPKETGEREKLSIDHLVNATEYQLQIAHDQLGSILNRL
jgi:hypothetical protein